MRVARLRKAYVATEEDGCANPWLSGYSRAVPPGQKDKPGLLEQPERGEARPY